MSGSLLQSIWSVIKTRQVFWMIWGAIVLFNLLFYMGYVRERRERAQRLETEYNDARRDLARISSRDDAYRAYTAAKAALQTFRRMLPEEKDREKVAGELKQIIDDNGLLADGEVRFKAEGIVDLLLLKYSMAVSLQGDYEQVKKALAEIQNSPRLLAVEKMSLQAGAQSEGRVVLNLVLSTYFRGSMHLQPLDG